MASETIQISISKLCSFFYWGGEQIDPLATVCMLTHSAGYYHTMVLLLNDCLKMVTAGDSGLCVRFLMVAVTNDDISMFTQSAA